MIQFFNQITLLYFGGVLGLDTESLFDFILEDKLSKTDISLDPLSIMSRLEYIKKLKPLENLNKANAASEFLVNRFEKYKPINQKGQILLLSMYCSALYLQLQRLEERGFNMINAKSKMGGISGISNNGFTPKDFMDKYTTGAKKLIYGNPYVREEFVKGEGKVKHFLTKASGQLSIHLDIDLDKAIELKTMIDNAGVSAFYLGKKGLAYVSHIDVR
uniref:Cas5fv helical domain-containing protein n=1 Tax=Methylophaga nitratireducenticrescens TaxID=754476 RepID=I1XLY1_METNJ